MPLCHLLRADHAWHFLVQAETFEFLKEGFLCFSFFFFFFLAGKSHFIEIDTDRLITTGLSYTSVSVQLPQHTAVDIAERG